MSVTIQPPITIDEMIDEVQREISNRRYSYGRLVSERKLNARRADRQIAIMEAVLDLLIKMNEPPPTLRKAA